jgi:hypothetical protein
MEMLDVRGVEGEMVAAPGGYGLVMVTLDGPEAPVVAEETIVAFKVAYGKGLVPCTLQWGLVDVGGTENGVAIKGPDGKVTAGEREWKQVQDFALACIEAKGKVAGLQEPEPTVSGAGDGLRVISKTEALREGLPRYFTGKPCSHGHVAEKLTRNSHCVECEAERGTPKTAARRKEYREGLRADPVRWARHQEKRKAYLRDTRAHIERVVKAARQAGKVPEAYRDWSTRETYAYLRAMKLVRSATGQL